MKDPHHDKILVYFGHMAHVHPCDCTTVEQRRNPLEEG